jgi:hypothetical protein
VFAAQTNWQLGFAVEKLWGSSVPLTEDVRQYIAPDKVVKRQIILLRIPNKTAEQPRARYEQVRDELARVKTSSLVYSEENSWM